MWCMAIGMCGTQQIESTYRVIYSMQLDSLMWSADIILVRAEVQNGSHTLLFTNPNPGFKHERVSLRRNSVQEPVLRSSDLE